MFLLNSNFVDLSLVVQILPVGIGSIELIFYKILTNVNFNQSEIISIVSLFRAVVHITTFILGSLLFYKYFNLSLRKKKIMIKKCSLCVLDTTVPQIKFNQNGVCNFCELHFEQKYYPISKKIYLN